MVEKEIVVVDVVQVAAVIEETCTSIPPVRPRTTVLDSTVEVLVVTVQHELHVVVVEKEIIAVDVVQVDAAVEETATMVIVDFCSI